MIPTFVENLENKERNNKNEGEFEALALTLVHRHLPLPFCSLDKGAPASTHTEPPT